MGKAKRSAWQRSATSAAQRSAAARETLWLTSARRGGSAATAERGDSTGEHWHHRAGQHVARRQLHTHRVCCAPSNCATQSSAPSARNHSHARSARLTREAFTSTTAVAAQSAERLVLWLSQAGPTCLGARVGDVAARIFGRLRALSAPGTLVRGLLLLPQALDVRRAPPEPQQHRALLPVRPSPAFTPLDAVRPTAQGRRRLLRLSCAAFRRSCRQASTFRNPNCACSPQLSPRACTAAPPSQSLWTGRAYRRRSY